MATGSNGRTNHKASMFEVFFGFSNSFPLAHPSGVMLDNLCFAVNGIAAVHLI
jgi:hypothetical protein